MWHHLNLGILWPLDATKSIYLKEAEKKTKSKSNCYLLWNSCNLLWKKHSPTANTLFSSVSTGTGLPDWSISFHNPVTPMLKNYFFKFSKKNLPFYCYSIRSVSIALSLLFSANRTIIIWQAVQSLNALRRIAVLFENVKNDLSTAKPVVIQYCTKTNPVCILFYVIFSNWILVSSFIAF